MALLLLSWFTGVVPAVAAALEPSLNVDPEPELRLHIRDPQQELRTTSVNWIDLVVSDKKTISNPYASAKGADSANPLALRIFIDAGHGGNDLGAPGLYGLLEKRLVLRIVHLVKQELTSFSRASEFPVVIKMSRDGDYFVPLEERVRLANEWGADVFLSIHGNSSPVGRVQGFEVYFLNPRATDVEAANLARIENEGENGPVKTEVQTILSDLKLNLHVKQSCDFAEKVYDEMSSRLRPSKRGVRQAPFRVLVGTAMPAVLIEVGYLTNEAEGKKLKNGLYLKRMANAISSGVIGFLMGLRGFG